MRFHAGYMEARERVLKQSREQDLELLDNLYGREPLYRFGLPIKDLDDQTIKRKH